MSTVPMLPASRRALRDELGALVAAQLLGPAGGAHEEVPDARVSERYLVGTLAPRKLGLVAGADEPEPAPAEDAIEESLAVDGPDAGDDGAAERSIAAVEQMVPSSIGLSFAVLPGTEELELRAGWGQYVRERSDGDHLTATGEPRMVWKRVPRGGTVALRLAPGPIPERPPDAEQPEVVVRGRVRDVGGQRLVSVFLVNGQVEPEQSRDLAWVFQPELHVRHPGGDAAIVRRAPLVIADADPQDRAETATQDMLHRGRVELAVGHNVATHVTCDATAPERATDVRTTVMPAHEVPLTEAPTVDDDPALGAVELDMRALAKAGADALPGQLAPLVDAYEGWIERQRARVADPHARLGGHEEAAAAQLEHCVEAAARLRLGIAALADDDVREAFQAANEAMWRQRVHTRAAGLRAAGDERPLDELLAQADEPANRSWRPFQLAFVLLGLPGTGDLHHPERGEPGLVDLLWFPTGGGKTEAYLGLTAFTLVLRRLRGGEGGRDGTEGVGVLMRYTLRLLTLQQFQRAAALVCALETMRAERADARWGTTPFRIGLWVGARSTPNRTKDAVDWVTRAKRGSAGGQRSPAQLTRCPWCGSEIDPKRHIEASEKAGRTVIYCGDPSGDCRFSRRQRPGEGLPALVVDEEIYRLLPGLLIATVDKFAQMPWRGATQALFGHAVRRCTRHGFLTPDESDHPSSHRAEGGLPAASVHDVVAPRPPDLVIQDELHLISGPLGSLVGLYESAVDRLSSWVVEGHTVRPKVVASTATIRRAEQQVDKLFARHVRVFPPSGLDARDSFFALQRDRPGDAEEHPGRRYVGICAPGRRVKQVLIRVYVAQMAAAQQLIERHGASADAYMTLVGYFNSLRELGGMRRLVDDDVSTRLGKMAEHGLPRRSRPMLEELTSRRSAGDIPRVLDRLAVGHEWPRPQKRDGPPPVDVLLATNMISVGVDVPRLGAMVCAGQPKAVSEYIQATSRVGRSDPGLVLTVYNWARPRDLSHYETFEHFHATFYRHVEALSVTPFSPRALDRGLTGVLAALLRLGAEEWNANRGAELVDRHADRVTRETELLAARAADREGRQEVADELRAQLAKRLERWSEAQDVEGRKLGYKTGGKGTVFGLLREPGPERWGTWTVPMSLREVEAPVTLVLREQHGAGPTTPYVFPDKQGDED